MTRKTTRKTIRKTTRKTRRILIVQGAPLPAHPGAHAVLAGMIDGAIVEMIDEEEMIAATGTEKGTVVVTIAINAMNRRKMNWAGI